jgi:NADH-quinone oxidoreductase subunit E
MSTLVNHTSLISEAVRKEIDRWLKKYPPTQQQSGVLYALRLVQEQNGGWLSVELLEAVADYLQMPKIAVFEVATFYSMYNLKPVGRHTFSVCGNISCMLRGSEKIMQHLQTRLGIVIDETTPDGRFTLKQVECLAACGGAPAMQLDDRYYYENLTPESIDVLLGELEQKN